MDQCALQLFSPEFSSRSCRWLPSWPTTIAGKSGSNPDGDGLDKPVSGDAFVAAGGGGTQGPAYFDGNNGCGQDRKQDVAPDHQGGYDDNNGNCGSQKAGSANNANAAASAQAQAAVAAQAVAKGEKGAEAQAQAPTAVAAARQARAAQQAAAAEVQAPTAVAAEVQAPTAVAAETQAQALPVSGGRPGDGGMPSPLLALILGVAGLGLAGTATLARSFVATK